MYKYNQVGTCTYCGSKNTKVREASIDRRRGCSTVTVCSDSLCEVQFQTDPLGFNVFETKLEHGSTQLDQDIKH